MSLQSFYTENFRCFHKLEILFDPKLTVIVAENGGGKTALMDAIALTLTTYLSRFSSVDQKLRFSKLSNEDFMKIPWGKSYSAIDPVYISSIFNIEGTQKNLILFSNQNKQKAKAEDWVFQGREKEITFAPAVAYYGCQRAGREATPQRLRDKGHNYELPEAAFIDCLNAKPNYREFIQWFDWFEADELRSQRDNTAFLNPLNAVRSALEAFYATSDCSFANPRFIMNPRRFVIDQISQGKKQVFPFDNLSDGYRMMTALVMDFARRLAQLHPDLPADQVLNKPGIMLIDEVDLHLHPTWQQRILPDLMRTFPMTQFIVTTHSPQVISSVASVHIRIIKDKQVFSASPGTEGAEPQRLLKEIFGLDNIRAPGKARSELEEYLNLVYTDKWACERALELRMTLDARYQGHEPALLEADVHIDNRKWEQEQQ